ncbi:MAG: hypothetical protein H6553_06055 [Chitinophagales bacterium]|nr:hypothetical protein [Chitinophagales bacterium]
MKYVVFILFLITITTVVAQNNLNQYSLYLNSDKDILQLKQFKSKYSSFRNFEEREIYGIRNSIIILDAYFPKKEDALYSHNFHEAIKEYSIAQYNLLSENSLVIKNDTMSFKVPQFKQGFFCNFEDNIQKKKIPLNFQLGNQKY